MRAAIIEALHLVERAKDKMHFVGIAVAGAAYVEHDAINDRNRDLICQKLNDAKAMILRVAGDIHQVEVDRLADRLRNAEKAT